LAHEATRLKSVECEEIRARFETALRGAQIHVYSQDRDLRYTWLYNPRDPDAAATMLGRTDEELWSSPEQQAVTAVKRQVLATGEPANCEASYLTPERRAMFALHIDPVFSADGNVEGIICAAIDVSRIRSLETERRRLTEELATAAQRYEFALRGSHVTVFTQDGDLRYTSVSKPLFGLEINAIEGATDKEILPPASAEEMIAFKQMGLAKGEADNAELRIEGASGTLWYDFHLEPMRDVSGSTIGLTGAAVDITERKQGEAHLRLLLRELTHRSKNLLAVIQAMARQTAKHGGTVQTFVERFGERVQALARSHDLLVAESWRSASLYDLVRSQLAFYIDREPDNVVIEGPEIKLRPEAAQSLGLALHELAINAVRHGAMSKSGGRVSISWRGLAPNDGFELLWRETGGPKVTAPKRRGFGSMAIEHNLARALDADVSLDFATEGLTCRIFVPRSQLAAKP
jgi:PAS domain S-box-containing protein